MKRKKRRVGRAGRRVEVGGGQERQRKKKQWRQREPERDSYKDRKKSAQTTAASLRGQRGPEIGGNVWWRVQVTELNPGSQADRVPAGRPILNLLLAGSSEKVKRREGVKGAGPR